MSAAAEVDLEVALCMLGKSGILVQQPGASRVAGFHTWLRLGRQVRRGEHAMWILAPVTRRVVVDGEARGSKPRSPVC